MDSDMTGREFEETIQRRDEYQREAMLLALCLCALSGATVGFAWAWWIWA